MYSTWSLLYIGVCIYHTYIHTPTTDSMYVLYIIQYVCMYAHIQTHIPVYLLNFLRFHVTRFLVYVNCLFSTWCANLLCGDIQCTHSHVCIMWLAFHLNRNDPTSYRFWSATIYLAIVGMAVLLCLPWLEALMERRFFVWFFAYAFNSSKVCTYVRMYTWTIRSTFEK